MCDEQTADEYEIDFSAPDGNAYSVCGAVGIFCCWVRRLTLRAHVGVGRG